VVGEGGGRKRVPVEEVVEGGREEVKDVVVLMEECGVETV